MKKMPVAALAAALLLFAASCKDDVTPGTTTYPNYTQLKTGNYWIYELYDVDSMGNGNSMNNFDSCYVSRDSVINGNIYYYLQGSPFLYSNVNNKWFRDSLSYLVDLSGKIYFSSEDMITTFSDYLIIQGDTMARVREKMDGGPLAYTVPAGTFVTLDCRISYELLAAPYDRYGRWRYLHQRYAKDIGLLSETLPFYTNTPRYTERRLVRYHLN